MEAIWQTAVHTPWWVYLLLIYLVKLGIDAFNMQTIPLLKLFIIPILFTWMSVHTLITSFAITESTVGVWGGALLLGIILGWLQIYRMLLQVDKAHFLIRVPGRSSVLVIILLIFSTKYYFGYALSVDPSLSDQTGFEVAMLGISGVLTGTFIGKLLCYLFRLYTSESVNLKN